MMLKSKEKLSCLSKIKYLIQYSWTKLLTPGLWGCLFLFFYNFYIFIFYFVREVLCICTDNRNGFSMTNNSMRDWDWFWIETGCPQGWLCLFLLLFTFYV
jgi:hypothetical protein